MMYELFVEPWVLGAWMWRGVLASVLVALCCAPLGVFLYLRRMSMLADALAHVALPGIVLAFLLSGKLHPLILLVGATAAGLIASSAIEGLASLSRIRSDAAIGIVFTAMFAAGIIMLSMLVHDAHIDPDCVLFGNVLGISRHTLTLLAYATPLVWLVVLVGWRWLAVTSFDAQFARTLGVPVTLAHYGLLAAVSMSTVASFEAVGAILVIALIVVPAATAHLLCDRLVSMVALATAHGVLSAIAGMYIAVWINCSPAGAMVLVAGLLYLVAFLGAPKHGRLTRWWQRRRRREAVHGTSAEASSAASI